jgi:hypothetical protein
MDPTFTIEPSNGTDTIISALLNKPKRTSTIIITKSDNKAIIQKSQHQILKDFLLEPLYCSEFVVPFIRDPPDVTKLTLDELQNTTIWNTNSLPYLFDDESSINLRSAAERLLSKIPSSKMNEWQEKCIINEIKQDCTILDSHKFSTEDFHVLSANNPKLCGVLMAERVRHNPALYEEYSRLDLNESTISAIVHIMLNLNPPENFLTSFIDHSINSIKSARDNNRKAKSNDFIKLLTILNDNKVNFSSKTLLDISSMQLDKNFKEQINKIFGW